MTVNRFGPGANAVDPTGDVPGPTARAVLRAVRAAEVLYIAFPHLQRALVIDPRPGEPEYPAALVAVLGFGAGGGAKAVEKLRPGRPTSARSIATTWGGSTRAFAEQGVLAAIIARLPADEVQAVQAAFTQLQEAEGGNAAPRTRPRLPDREEGG